MWLFKGKIRWKSSGHYGYAVRVLPKHANLGGNVSRARTGVLGIS